MTFARTFALSAIAALGTTAAAHAALIDFTDPTTYSISGSTGSGSVGGLSYSLSAVGGDFDNSEAATFDADRVAPLAGIVDGLGIRDDEVTFPRESVTITFGTNVTLSNLYFLDLFGTNPGGEAEETDENVTVVTGNGTSQTFFAQTLNQDGTVGFGSFATSLSGRSFTFIPGEENDAFARPDFALAGLEVAAIPLPAGVLLLGGALGGLGFARRARKKSA